MSEPIHYPGITSCGCPYIKQPDPARHWKDCHYRLNSERDAQQAEPTDTFTAVDMATAAAQGFRDGQAAVEQAPVQDEREAFKRALHSQKVFKLSSATIDAAEWAWFSRPAQTEQQPIRLPQRADTSHGDAFDTQLAEAYNAALDEVTRLNAAPIAQTVPQPEQTAPEGYVLLPKQCPSWLEDAYDECCEADQHFEPGL